MTLITEYRYKCDYCGNVSPAFDVTFARSGGYPTGWVMMGRGEYYDFYNMKAMHFCNQSHLDMWQTAQTAKGAA